jgi:hypothetical protein
VLAAPAGIEILGLEGDFTDEVDRFTRESWLRLPPGSTLRAKAGAKGCKVWVKSGHLPLGRTAGDTFKTAGR